MRLLLAILLAAASGAATVRPEPYAWQTYDSNPGPGGFATIVIDHPKHGQQVPGSDTVLRLRSDNRRAAVHLLVDGRVIGGDGTPIKDQPQDLNAVVPVQFMDGLSQHIPVNNLAPGLHTIQIRAATRGTELPHINRQELEFVSGSGG